MPAPSHRDAFRTLRGALLRRRLQRLDPRLRGEILLLAVLVNGFLFWQARIPLDGDYHSRHGLNGPWAVVRVLTAYLAALVPGAAVMVGGRLARRVAGTLPGPAWLALPVSPRDVLDQLAWEARLEAVVALALAPGLLVAAHGLVPWWGLVAIALAFVAVLALAARVATAAATAFALATTRAPGRVADPLLDRLSDVRHAAARARFRAPRWRRLAAWRALWLKDARLARRPTPARARAGAPLVFAAASGGVWFLGLEPPLAHALAFGLGLVAAGSFAEFLIALGASEPVPVLRALPLGAGAIWLGRAAWALLAAAALALVQLACARPIYGSALGVLLVWLSAAALAIALLGAHYGITLGAQAGLAQRFLMLTLGIAIAASLMIPLMGWIVLFTAVIHSGRRVPRWARLEDER